MFQFRLNIISVIRYLFLFMIGFFVCFVSKSPCHHLLADFKAFSRSSVITGLCTGLEQIFHTHLWTVRAFFSCIILMSLNLVCILDIICTDICFKLLLTLLSSVDDDELIRARNAKSTRIEWSLISEFWISIFLMNENNFEFDHIFKLESRLSDLSYPTQWLIISNLIWN